MSHQVYRFVTEEFPFATVFQGPIKTYIVGTGEIKYWGRFKPNNWSTVGLDVCFKTDYKGELKKIGMPANSQARIKRFDSTGCDTANINNVPQDVVFLNEIIIN